MTGRSDIAIIGGGVAGAALAHFLAPHRSVAMVEREQALGYHSTGRSAAEFTLRFHSKLAGLLTLASKPFFMEPPEGFAETPLLRPRGNLLIAGPEKAHRVEEVLAEEADGPEGAPPIRRLSTAEALEMVPFLDPEWLTGALYDPDCWDVEVESLLQGFVRSAKAEGARVIQNAALQGARRDGGDWVLETTAGEVRAGIVVNAAGGWADPVAAMFGGEPLGIVPHRRTAISVKAEGYDVSGMPEVNEIDEEFYFKPDAGQLMVSPADETPVDPHDAWPEEIDIATAAYHLTECTTLEVKTIAHSWAGLRTFAPDRAPVVGFSGQAEGLFWLAGQGGYGIQTSPGVGRWAAGLILDGRPPEDMTALGLTEAALSPSRLER